MIEFTEENLEQLDQGKINNTTVTPYMGPTVKEIGSATKVKITGVKTNEKLEIGDHTLKDKKWYWSQAMS